MSYDLKYKNNITTNDDMLEYKGIDLTTDLVLSKIDDADEKSIAARAINDVEEWIINYVNVNYSFEGDRSDLNDYQKGCFKKAVCEQIDYILDNGDLRNASGINIETGIVIDKKILDMRGLSTSAWQWLRKCGMANYRRC